jgi:hypothetical protein
MLINAAQHLRQMPFLNYFDCIGYETDETQTVSGFSVISTLSVASARHLWQSLFLISKEYSTAFVCYQ